jgi:thioredoxin-like negative regulator of GroEL
MYPGEIDSLEQVEQLIRETPALLLYFYSDNCAPCISLRPKVVELVCDHFPELKLTFIDAQRQPEIAANFNAFNLPLLVLYFDGKEYNRDSKFIAIPQLSDTINRPYTLMFS